MNSLNKNSLIHLVIRTIPLFDYSTLTTKYTLNSALITTGYLLL